MSSISMTGKKLLSTSHLLSMESVSLSPFNPWSLDEVARLPTREISQTAHSEKEISR